MKDVVGEIGRLPVGAGDAGGVAGEHVKLARHLMLHDPDLAFVDDVLERLGQAGEVGIDAAESFLVGGVHEQPADEVGELVAGRPLDRPVLAQMLMVRQDLFDNEIKRLRRLFAQADAIALGIDQTVDMVDPDAVQRAVRHQIQYQTVRQIEQFRLLHPQSGQLVDVEETAVVDVVGGHLK